MVSSLKLKSAALATVAVIAVCAGAVRAEKLDDARKVVDSYKDAIVTIQVVSETTVSYERQNHKRESKEFATGTVIDPSGLTVVSLTSVNPNDMYSDMMDEEDSGMSFSTRVVDIKIKLGDGTEVPADMVLRDRDLDLAFVRPKKTPEQPLAYVDIAQSESPLILDEVVSLARLNQIANRSLAACIQRVASIVQKPRLGYVLNGVESYYDLGSPVFALNGKPIGISVLRASVSKDEDMSSMERMLPLVVPCSTVLNAANQAKTAAPIKEEVAPVAKPAEEPASEPAKKPAEKPATKPAPKKK